MKKTLSIILAAGLALAPTAAHATGGGHGHDPVTICHNGHTITVDDSSLKAHLKHGDVVGPCSVVVTPPTEEPTEKPTTPPTEEPSPEPTEPPVITPPEEEPSTPPTVPGTPNSEPPATPAGPSVNPPAPPVAAPPAVTPTDGTNSVPSDAGKKNSTPGVTSPDASRPELAETGFSALTWSILAGVLVAGGWLLIRFFTWRS